MNNFHKIYILLFLLLPYSLQSQPIKKGVEITLHSMIVDEKGDPIQGAKIYSNIEFAKTVSDNTGTFTLLIKEGTNLFIEANGFKSCLLPVNDFPNKIVLSSLPFMFGEESDVNIAYGKIKKGEIISDIQELKPSDDEKLNQNTNLANYVNGRVSGLMGYNNLRGLGNALVVVDGIARYSSLTSAYILPEEIESITFLKDLSAAVLYGSEARNGVILITTKRGKPNTKSMRIMANYGISTPKSLPNFLGSADYMTLYNEARVNDGLQPLYSESDISNYRGGANPYQYPSIDYYSSEFVKKFSTNSRVSADFTGGSKAVAYYANVGWERNSNFINFGKAKSMEYNRFNARTNIDFDITDYIHNSVGGSAVFYFLNDPRTDYFSEASTSRPNQYTPFLPIDSMDVKNPDIAALLGYNRNIIDGKYFLGGSSQLRTNPFADIYAGGYNQTVRRLMEFNNKIDIDLNRFVKGLTISTNVSFDFFNQYTQNISNSYAVYQPTWTNNKITALTKYNEDKYTGVLNTGYPSFYRRFGFYGLINYNRKVGNGHNITAQILAAGSTFFDYAPNANGGNTDVWPKKNANIGMRFAYNYKNTYSADFSSSVTNSTKLAPGHRISYSPTLALGWTLSNEAFLKKLTWIDFLKVKASGGMVNSDMGIDGFYFYDRVYSQSGSYAWNENLMSNSLSWSQQGPNPDLKMEKRVEYNLGLESSLLNKSLTISVNYFNTRITDQVGKMASAYPSYQGNITPYSNTAGTDLYKGVELGMTLEKKYGDFSFETGLNATFWDSKVLSRDETYAYNYLYRKGKPTDALFMLQSLGLFNTQEEIDGSPRQLFGLVKPGDIKYKDQNGDGVIDNNDVTYVGRSTSPVNLGLNLKISYKRLSLYALGIAYSGSDAQISGSYYRMSGDDKYSDIALNRWTEATKMTAQYPRLSSLVASNNNQSSTFWLYPNNYFNLAKIQLSYNFSKSICRSLCIDDMNAYLMGSNLATLGNKNSLRNQSTGSLITRSIAFGLNVTF